MSASSQDLNASVTPHPVLNPMRRAGLEPATPRLRGGCSCLLSFRRKLEGGTGRTRTVIISLDKRMPHLSATVP